MAQLKNVVEPFGEINVHPAGPGRLRVRATVLMDVQREGTRTGIALDGSGSTAPLYGIKTSFNPSAGDPNNQMSPLAREICAYLARKTDAEQRTACVYWSTGPRGGGVEEIGSLTPEQTEHFVFDGPKQFGTGTQLLPVVKYFVEKFTSAPWGFYVIITDGEVHDLEAVKDYTRELARSIEAGRRNPVKLVLVGIGPEVNERQMEELDDLDTGTSLDLWDHKLAAELRELRQIFAEVVDRNARVAVTGRVVDPNAQLVKDFSGMGVPSEFEFDIDASAAYFTLEVPGFLVHQSLSDLIPSPASEYTDGDAMPEVYAEEVEDHADIEALPIEDVQPDATRPATQEQVELDLKDLDGGLDFDLELRDPK